MEIQHEKTFKDWIEKHIQSTHSKKYKFDLGRYDCLEFETKRLGLNTRNGMWKLEADNIIKYSLDEYERIMASDGIVEIYTPIEIAYNMLKTIPVWVWSNPKVKLLNPCSKTGVFEYIAYCLFMEGLSDIIEDEDKRREHILNEQIFSIAMHWRFKEQITFMLTGKVLDKYERVISIKDYRCDIHEEGIYEMIERETGKSMQFDIIVGNPPYQEMTGGGDTTEVAMPLYHKFVSRAIDMKPKYISMIIPSRWTCGGKSVLDDFRSLMISEYKIKEINNYNVSNDIFDGVSIAGGVMYFLWDRDNTSKETVIHNNNKCSKVDLGKYRYVSKKGG